MKTKTKIYYHPGRPKPHGLGTLSNLTDEQLRDLDAIVVAERADAVAGSWPALIRSAWFGVLDLLRWGGMNIAPWIMLLAIVGALPYWLWSSGYDEIGTPVQDEHGWRVEVTYDGDGTYTVVSTDGIEWFWLETGTHPMGLTLPTALQRTVRAHEFKQQWGDR